MDSLSKFLLIIAFLTAKTQNYRQNMLNELYRFETVGGFQKFLKSDSKIFIFIIFLHIHKVIHISILFN